MSKTNIREFFAGAGRSEHAPATVGDICNALEAAGVSSSGEGAGEAAGAGHGSDGAPAAHAAAHADTARHAKKARR